MSCTSFPTSASNHPMSTIHSHHALGITEVLAAVAQNLSPSALACACRVNRSWFPVFAGQLWRTILEVPAGRDHETFMASLPRYAPFIRVLHCPPRWLPLFSRGLTCTQLTTIRFPPLTPASVSIAIEIIQQNKGLEDVFLEGSEFFEAKKEEQLLMALAELRCLRKLDINALRNVANSMEYLLQRLPLLKVLITSQWQRSNLAGRRIDMLAASKDIGTDLAWGPWGPRGHLQLTRLKASAIELDSESMRPILSVLQACPFLETLEIGNWQRHWKLPPTFDMVAVQSLATVLHESCPRLQDLIFSNLALDYNGLRTLLAFKPDTTLAAPITTIHWLSLRTLRLQKMDILLEYALQILEIGMDFLKDTLEVLQVIQRKSWPFGPSYPRIAWLLHTFTKLVSLILPPAATSLQDLYRDHDGERVWIPWACKDSIEVVNFQIECPNREWTEYDNILENRGNWDQAPKIRDYRDPEYVDSMLETCPSYGRALRDLNTMPKLCLRHVRFV